MAFIVELSRVAVDGLGKGGFPTNPATVLRHRATSWLNRAPVETGARNRHALRR
jgi:hypothetical protein